MLTAELVSAKIKAGAIQIEALTGDRRALAVRLSEQLLTLTNGAVGQSREEVEALWDLVRAPPRERKLGLALRKLIADRCVFEESAQMDPVEIRRLLFEAASEKRNADSFDRTMLVAEVATKMGSTPEAIEAALFADLRGAHRLVSVKRAKAEAIAEHFDLAEAQAILLRAVSVTVDVKSKSPASMRALFRALKFRQLLFRADPTDGGYRITIDGPFSLFESVTKYGLSLALSLPYIVAMDQWELQAYVQWGKARRSLVFRWSGTSRGPQRASPDPSPLIAEVNALDSGWKAAPAEELFPLPGVGICVPDFVVTKGKKRVYVELLGFWSRDALFHRVELVEKGLTEPFIFVAGKHLRVSEAVMAEDSSAALYMFKTVPHAKKIIEHAERVSSRPKRK